MPRAICANGVMPAPRPFAVNVVKLHPRSCECVACLAQDRAAAAKIARERAIATYGEGRC